MKHGRLEIEVTDGCGARPVRLALRDGEIRAAVGPAVKVVDRYEESAWKTVQVAIDTQAHTCTLAVEHRPALKGAAFSEAGQSVERLEFRTGPYRMLGRTGEWQAVTWEDGWEKKPLAVFHVDNVKIG